MTRATSTTRRSARFARPSTTCSRRQALPGRVSRASGACAARSGSSWPTRTSSSRARRRKVDAARPAGERRLLQHVRRAQPADARLPTGVASRPTRDRRRPPARGAALPRRAVPRRVDPHRERLRPDPRAAARRCCDDVTAACRGSWSSTTTTRTRTTSSTCRGGDRRAAGRRPARRPGRGRGAGATASPTSCCRPGRARCTDAHDFARRSRRARRGDGPGARCLPRHAGDRRRVAAARSSASSPAHGEVARDHARGHGRVRRRAAGLRGGALPLAGRGRRARRPRGDGLVRRADGPGRMGVRAPRAAVARRAVPPRVGPDRARRASWSPTSWTAP